MLHYLKVNFLGAKIIKNLSFFKLKNYAVIIYPSLAHLGLCIIEVGCFQFICTLSSTSVEIYDFALANRVNANKIIIFFTAILCSSKASMKALIGFGRCFLPSAYGPSCSKPKSVCTILMCQLWANSWKYMCLRMMDCLHHVTATCKVLKGLMIFNRSAWYHTPVQFFPVYEARCTLNEEMCFLFVCWQLLCVYKSLCQCPERPGSIHILRQLKLTVIEYLQGCNKNRKKAKNKHCLSPILCLVNISHSRFLEIKISWQANLQAN